MNIYLRVLGEFKKIYVRLLTIRNDLNVNMRWKMLTENMAFKIDKLVVVYWFCFFLFFGNETIHVLIIQGVVNSTNKIAFCDVLNRING